MRGGHSARCACTPRMQSKRSESEEELNEVDRSSQRAHPSSGSLRRDIAKAARRRVLENRINVTATFICGKYYTTTSKINQNKRAVIKCGERWLMSISRVWRRRVFLMSKYLRSSPTSKAKQKYLRTRVLFSHPSQLPPAIRFFFFFFYICIFFLIALTADTHG